MQKPSNRATRARGMAMRRFPIRRATVICGVYGRSSRANPLPVSARSTDSCKESNSTVRDTCANRTPAASKNPAPVRDTLKRRIRISDRRLRTSSRTTGCTPPRNLRVMWRSFGLDHRRPGACCRFTRPKSARGPASSGGTLIPTKTLRAGDLPGSFIEGYYTKLSTQQSKCGL